MEDNEIENAGQLQVGQRVKLHDYNYTGLKRHANLVKEELLSLRMDVDTFTICVVRNNLPVLFSSGEVDQYDRYWRETFNSSTDDQTKADLLKQRFGFNQYDPDIPTPLLTQFNVWQQDQTRLRHIQNTPDGVYHDVNVSINPFGLGISFGWITDSEKQRHFYIGPMIGTPGYSVSDTVGWDVAHGWSATAQGSLFGFAAQGGYNFEGGGWFGELGFGYPFGLSFSALYTY